MPHLMSMNIAPFDTDRRTYQYNYHYDTTEGKLSHSRLSVELFYAWSTQRNEQPSITTARDAPCLSIEPTARLSVHSTINKHLNTQIQHTFRSQDGSPTQGEERKLRVHIVHELNLIHFANLAYADEILPSITSQTRTKKRRGIQGPRQPQTSLEDGSSTPFNTAKSATRIELVCNSPSPSCNDQTEVLSTSAQNGNEIDGLNRHVKCKKPSRAKERTA